MLAGATLGVRCRGDDPALLYIFALSGGDAPGERTLRPVRPELFPTLTPPGDPRPAPIDLEPGEHWVACTVVGEPDPNEGFLVFACEERNPLLELWQQSLANLEAESLVPTRYPDAMAIGRSLLGQSRGESPGALSREERLQLFSEVLAGEGSPEDEWRIPGVRRYLFLFPTGAPRGEDG